jgi:HEAT repeat protein
MKTQWISTLPILLLALALPATAQDVEMDVDIAGDNLKLVALEALMAAPDEKALPIVIKLLDGDGNEDLKEAALFILSQIDAPEAHAKLLEIAGDAADPLRPDAIRMIGIGGDAESITKLAALYAGGDAATRDAVMEAYLIAGDVDAVYQIALSARDNEEFESAVEMLAAMGARDELRQLRQSTGNSESLIEAYAVAGDAESLLALARDESDVKTQAKAIEALGIVGGDEVDGALLEIYRNTDSDYIRNAALGGMLISGNDENVLQLYRQSNDLAEKRELLRALSAMGSDRLFEVIDETLTGTQ